MSETESKSISKSESESESESKSKSKSKSKIKINSKSFFKDLLLSIPIFIFYILFINKLCETLTSSLPLVERNKKILVGTFIGSIVGLIFAFYVFNYNNKFGNRSIKYGLIIGSIYLMGNTIICNWDSIPSDTKLFMIGTIFGLFIILSYFI
jgi:hypothetical protein